MRFCTVLLLSLLAMAAPLELWAQNRSVAVVYDNSGSMQQSGQCEGVNYALQLMVGLLHPQDELYVYRMEPPTNGNRINLSNKKAAIASVSSTYDCSAKRTPYAALLTAAQQLAASNKSFRWLIVLSDGDITDANFAQNNNPILRTTIESSGTRLLFLNVNAVESQLDRHLQNTQTPNNTLRTRGSFEQIIGTMEQIAGNVMTLSKGGVKAQAQGVKVVINTPVPLKKMIVLAQDATKNAQLPKLLKASLNGTNLQIEEPYLAQKGKGSDYQMTGVVTHIKSGKGGDAVIPKGELTLLFDKTVDVSKIKFLPEVAARLAVEIQGSFKAENGNTYTVCDTVRQLTVVGRLLDDQNKPLDVQVLKASRVQFIDEKTKRSTVLSYRPSTADFGAIVPLNTARMVVSAAAAYEGYFNYQSNILVVVRETCPNPKASISANKTQLRAKVTDLAHAETLTITPMMSVGNLPPRAAISAELKDLYFEPTNGDPRLQLSISEQGGKLIIQPVAWLCACFTPTGTETLTWTLRSKNKQIVVEPNQKLSVQVTVEDDSFWAKCGKLIIGILATLFGLWYAWGVYRKQRFCSGAEVVYTKTTPLLQHKPKSYPLKTGFVSRYLVPYTAEKQAVGGVTFKAGNRCSHIFIDCNAQNERMFISGFPIEDPRKKDLRLSNGEQLEVNGLGNSKEIYEYRKL